MKSRTTRKIWVNPVERISWQGRHKQVYTIRTDTGDVIPTVPMKKTRENNTTAEFFFPIDPNRNKLVTTLGELKTNPFKGFKAEEVMSNYSLPAVWKEYLPGIVNQDKIKKQTIYEIEDGVDPDFYTDEVGYTMFNLPSDMNKYGEKTYLQSLKLVLYPRPNPFEDSSPRQRLLMDMIDVLPAIAKNKNQVNSAFHDWYISQENEAEEEKARKNDIIEEATYKLYKLKHELGRYRSYQMAIVLRYKDGRPIFKGEGTSETINNVLSGFLLDDSRQQMDNIEQFLEVFELLDDVDGIEKFEVWYLVQQAVNTNVISHRDNEYIWHSKAGTPDVYKLGTSFDKMVNFFLKEYKTYNPKSDVSNWYKDLHEEVQAKGIWIEDK